MRYATLTPPQFTTLRDWLRPRLRDVARRPTRIGRKVRRRLEGEDREDGLPLTVPWVIFRRPDLGLILVGVESGEGDERIDLCARLPALAQAHFVLDEPPAGWFDRPDAP